MFSIKTGDHVLYGEKNRIDFYQEINYIYITYNRLLVKYSTVKD